MFIFPIGTEVKLKNIPYVTIIIALIILFSYYFTQKQIRKFNKRKYEIFSQLYKYIGKNYDKEDITSFKEMYENINRKIKNFISGTEKIPENWKNRDKILEEINQLKKIIHSHPFNKYGFNGQHPKLINAVTYTFIHGSIWHLIGNLYFFLFFGIFVEDILGKIRYILLYILSAISSAYFFAWFRKADVPLIGVSGVIFAIMAVFAIFFYDKNIKFLFILILIFIIKTYKFMVNAIYAILVYALIELFSMLSSTNSAVAHAGHIGGFISGLLIASILRFTPYYNKLKEEYFQRTATKNPENILSEIDEFIGKEKYSEALDLLNKGISINSKFYPFYRKKLEIYSHINDNTSLKLFLPKYFEVVKELNDVWIDDFVIYFNTFGFDIVNNEQILLDVILKLEDLGDNEKILYLAPVFLKHIKDKASYIYQKILTSYIFALMTEQRYDEAITEIDKAFKLVKSQPKQVNKFIEIEKEVFSKRYSTNVNIVDSLIKLEQLRIENKKIEYKKLFEKLMNIKSIQFTFEQLLFYSDLFDVKKDYKNVLKIYQYIIKNYENHQHIYIVLYRISQIFYYLIRDKEKSLKYANWALTKCGDSKNAEKISNFIIKIT